MADTGYRSIEVFVSNDLEGDLSVESATLGATASWMSGEEAEEGNLLEEFQTAIWGATTDDEGGAASASVTLGGLGDGFVRIEFSNSSNGQSAVIVTPNNKAQGAVEEIESEDDLHSQFRVRLHTTAVPL